MILRVRFSGANSAKVGFRDFPAGKYKFTCLSIPANLWQYSFFNAAYTRRNSFGLAGDALLNLRLAAAAVEVHEVQ